MSIHTEIFALESTLYEIWTAKKPYQDVSDKEIQHIYGARHFPDIEGLIVCDVIPKCWTGRYSDAAEVAKDLHHLQAQFSETKRDAVKDDMDFGSSEWRASILLDGYI